MPTTPSPTTPRILSRPKLGRSPAYPGVPLQTALEKAKAQFDAEGKYAIPLASAFKSWGYSDKSSGGRDIRASLRYFGLITVDGDGDSAKVKLTEDALRVLLDHREDQTEKKTIIRRLALNPAAHKKLWNKFPEGIKSDATAAHYLVFDESYNQAAANALIAEFKQTATFAGLYEPDAITVISDSGAEENDQHEDGADENNRPSDHNPPPPPPLNMSELAMMQGERIAFVEESQPGQYLKLIAAGEVDDSMLEALEDFVKRQRKRLSRSR